jgi:hypothetical protein
VFAASWYLLADKAKAGVTYGNFSELQKFIRHHAAAYQIERRGEFWYLPSMASTGDTVEPGCDRGRLRA